MAEENTTQATEQQQEKPTKMKCPCCGEMTLNRPPEIKSAVLDEYMASIITGVPFQHTYTLYGTVDVTVAILSKQQGRLLYTATQLLDRLIKTDVIKDKQLVAALSELHGTMQLYSAIPSIKTYKEKRLQKEFTPADVVFTACAQLVHNQTNIEKYYWEPDYESVVQQGEGNFPDIPGLLMELYHNCCQEEKLSSLPDLMLRAIARTHSDIYNILMETGFDENFWRGIELA